MIKRILIYVLISVVQSVSWADVRLPRLFSDNIVMQQGMPVPVWGGADPGRKITVRLGNQQKHAAAAGLERFLKEIDKADSIHRKNASQPAAKRCRHPLRLWNGMVHPLVPFAVRGALWYQGEANVKRPAKYALKMKALIGGWRSAWGRKDFSFYFVQLPPYKKNDERLCLIQEAQLESLSIANTGMVVTTDLIESDRLWDHHPKNKKDVGKRLALWALAKDYGCRDIVYSGPLYKSMSVEGGRVRILFDHTGSGLDTRDGKPPDWFEIAGRDKKFVKFVKADAGIDGNCVLVWNNTVPRPAAVRFGWHQEAQPNLINKEGLPASPFRTHKW